MKQELKSKIKKVSQKLYSSLIGEVKITKYVAKERVSKRKVERQTRDMIRDKIMSDKAFMQKVIVLVFENGQEKDEKKAYEAIYKNRRGFTKAQAHRGTEYAHRIMKGQSLKGDDVQAALKIAYLYVQQILEMLEQESRYAWLAKKKA